MIKKQKDHRKAGNNHAHASTRAARIKTSFVKRIVFYALGIPALFLRALNHLTKRKGDHPNFVLLEPYGMGDVLSLGPLASQLAKNADQVYVCCQSRWSPLIAKNDEVVHVETVLPWTTYDSAHKYSESKTFFKKGLHALRSLRTVSRGAIGIDPRGDIRSVILLYLAGCRAVYTFDRYYVAADCTILPGAARRLSVPEDKKRWEVNLELIRRLEEDGVLKNDGTNTRHRRPSVDHLYDQGLVTNPGRLGLIPMTPWEGKRWPAEHWQAIVTLAESNRWHPVGLCGPGESEEAKQYLGETEIHSCDSVSDWVHNLQRCQAVIAVNTGPMHLADALDKPIVVIVGSCQLPLWAPSNEHATVSHHQDKFACAPCHQVGENLECAARCMSDVRPHEVWHALSAVTTPSPIHAPRATPHKTTQNTKT